MREFDGRKLTRAPRGFPADSPALDLLICRQWGVSATLPANFATEPKLLKEIVRRFKLAAPLVHFLNAGIVGEGAGKLRAAKPDRASRNRRTAGLILLHGLREVANSAKSAYF